MADWGTLLLLLLFYRLTRFLNYCADDDDFQPPAVVAEAPKKQWELEDKDDWEKAEPAVPFPIFFRNS